MATLATVDRRALSAVSQCQCQDADVVAQTADNKTQVEDLGCSANHAPPPAVPCKPATKQADRAIRSLNTMVVYAENI